MQQEYNYTPLPEPIPITEQVWPEGTLPLVCTSTLAYNHEPYIRECLDGILMQKTTFPVQVLVHEDCSTDRTAEILKEYQAKYPNLIKVFYQPENVYSLKDQEEKRKRRAEYNSWRTGKYIALCEGDDYWIDPLKLQKQVDFLEANSDYGMVYTSFNVIDELGNAKNIKFYKKCIYQSFSGDIFLELLKDNFILTLTTLFRKEILMNELNNKDFYFDYLLFLNAAGLSKIHFINNKTSNYRINPNGAIRSRNKEYQNKRKLTIIYVSYLYLDSIFYRRTFIKYILILEQIVKKNILIYISNFEKKNIIKLFFEHKKLLFLIPFACIDILYSKLCKKVNYINCKYNV